MSKPRHRAPARRPTRGRRRRLRRRAEVGSLRALLRLGTAGALLAIAVTMVPPLRATATAVREAVLRAALVSRYSTARDTVVLRYAWRFGIPVELASLVERTAVAEGVDPDLAFRLVRVESGFRVSAVSSAGALGLTQLMPATAESLQAGITREQIFEPETNLRLGFRYLRWLLGVYDGDVDEALHAYNRGPGTVARIRATGGDPANGYADRVLGRSRSLVPYRGTGRLPGDLLPSDLTPRAAF